MKTAYTNAGATISACGKYRYRLWREWRSLTTPNENWGWCFDAENGSPVLDGGGYQLGSPKSVVFIMLNPSTADGDFDDPTIRRCVCFAKLWGYDRIDVLNLFAFRATSPKDLLALRDDDDPVGPENLRHFRRLIEDDDAWSQPLGPIVCAWGSHGSHLRQDETVRGWLEDRPLHALKINEGGQPGHPLYVPAATKLVEFA